jgi:DNA-binding XRE family transcriptional regulator
MSAPYTSYETSVALRDAGAPQAGGDRDWAEQEGTEPLLVKADCFLLPGEVRGPRAFRADEIADILHSEKRIVEIVPFDTGRWYVRIRKTYGRWVEDYFGNSFVEAIAQAWLAVLKEARRGSEITPDDYDERLAAGKLIREFREQHDLSLGEAARALKISASALCDCERGRSPLSEVHLRLAQLKEVPRG